MSCRIAIVAASPLIAAGLVAALSDDGVEREVARFDSVDAALGAKSPPDVLVAAIDAADDAMSLYDDTADRVRLVLLGDAAAALPARAHAEDRPLAVLSAHPTPQQVRAAVAAVLADLQLRDPALPPADALWSNAEPPGEPLTPRELEVFELLAKGLRNRDIAAALGISEHTAKFHVGQILGKIGASTRAEAVGLGLRMGLIGV